MTKLNGAQIFLECLKAEGIKDIFGYPGGAVLPIYDALYKEKKINHILVRHEQGGVHAADGYARATGKVGVCLVTSGPGATNTVTGLATAYMDSIPMVCFTGQVPTALIGNDAFQEADIVGITRPCTKHNYLVKDVNDLPRIIKEAFYIAGTGRPGPVLIDLPKDILNTVTEFKGYPKTVDIPSYQPTVKGHIGQIKKALHLILKSKKPVFYAGGGVILSDASSELNKLVNKLNMPTTLTLMGLGGIPGTSKHFLGMLGMHGTYAANMAVTNTDCLVAIGSRFDDRVTGKIAEFAPNAKIIHIDIDPTSISKNVTVDVPIVGDVNDVLKEMSKLIPKMTKEVTESKKHITKWHKEIDAWKDHHSLKTGQAKTGKIKAQHVIERTYEITKGDAIITTEVGQHQMWAAQFFKYNKARSFITSGGLGTMGFGFPAAMGAQVAFPKKTVIDIAGDGSIQMMLQELTTCLNYKLPVKIFILNNSYLGMVRQWQEFFHDKNYSHSYMSHPDFVKLAEAYGGVGLSCKDVKDVDSTIKKALAVKDRPVVVDFKVDAAENVYPMVPAGKAINEMLLV